MKTNKFLILLLVTVSLISCKKEESKPAEEVVAAPEVFTFTLNAVVKSDDDFQIFFKEDNNPESPYEEVNSVWSGGIKGSENAQDIVFNLPEGVYPTQIRFDFGQKMQPEIVINSLKVNLKEKSFTLKGAEFFNYFTPDEKFVKVDQSASKITPIKQADDKYDPMLYSNTDFSTKLSEISK